MKTIPNNWFKGNNTEKVKTLFSLRALKEITKIEEIPKVGKLC